MKRLPPLKALPAFEAAARLSSFSAAGKELFVTHGAISRQVALLEENLGTKLFERLPRGVQLNSEGRYFYVSVKRAFDDIFESAESLRNHNEDERQILTISTVPGLAVGWLVPRLHLFQKLHSNYEIRVSTSPRLVDFKKEGIDIGIRYGRGNWPGLKIVHLFKQQQFPVCAPSMLEGVNALRKPEDLAKVRLLHDASRQYWRLWFRLAGVDNVDYLQGWILDDSNALIQAATYGQGVALANPRTIQAELADGRLAKPFKITLTTEFSCYAVCIERRANEPKVAATLEWLAEEAAKQEMLEF